LPSLSPKYISAVVSLISDSLISKRAFFLLISFLSFEDHESPVSIVQKIAVSIIKTNACNADNAVSAIDQTHFHDP